MFFLISKFSDSSNYISFKDDLEEEREKNIERLYQDILKKKQTNGFKSFNKMSMDTSTKQISKILSFSTPQFQSSRRFVPDCRSFT